MTFRIQSDGEQALLTGDVAHHPCQMAHLDWSSTADSDPATGGHPGGTLFSRFADTSHPHHRRPFHAGGISAATAMASGSTPSRPDAAIHALGPRIRTGR